VHCDLKPENILLRKINKSGIKIIDFGSGCFENEKIYTYIQSRFYRAPEIVLGIPYNAAIDMWSFGCILYELYVGYPLFPGEDEKDHMALMMEVKGVPPRSVLARSSRRKVFFDDDYVPVIVPNSRGKTRMPGGKNLLKMMSCSDTDFVDFIDVSKYLVFCNLLICIEMYRMET
jgi:dual specificity tyrosine-phosphorylation-regulated kinase 2/3/4